MCPKASRPGLSVQVPGVGEGPTEVTFPAQLPAPHHVAMGSTESSRKVYTGTWAAVVTRHAPCSWYESM